MAYTVLTQDNLAKWWITGTGSVVNRLSEVMDDGPDGPAIYHLDADNDWTSGAGANEWYVATATKPDNVSENLAGWRNMTDAGDDQDGSLNVDEWSYDTGNNRVYVKLSDSSDANATDVRCDYDWDGAGAGPAFMTEHIEDRAYQMHLDLEIGDGSTSTTLLSRDEYVYFDNGAFFAIKNLATVTLGVLTEGEGVSGSFWHFNNVVVDLIMIESGQTTAAFNIYGSKIAKTGTKWIRIDDGDIVFNNSTIDCSVSNAAGFRIVFFQSLTIKDLLFENGQAFRIDHGGPSITNLRTTNTYYGFYTYKYAGDYTITVTGIIANNFAISFMYAAGFTNPATLHLIDSIGEITTPVIAQGAETSVNEKYTCNIKVTDKDGAAIANTATVACTRANVVTESAKFYKCITAHTSGTFATDLAAGKWVEITDATILGAAPTWLTTTDYVSAEAEFSVNPTSGDIAEQTITYKTWTGTSELETKYIHEFTFSEAGYETLILENVTVDAPVVWHLELQPPGGAGAKMKHIGIGVQI